MGIRTRDGFKLILYHDLRCFKGKWQTVGAPSVAAAAAVVPAGPWELFDLTRDPAESANAFEAMRAANGSLVAGLMRLLAVELLREGFEPGMVPLDGQPPMHTIAQALEARRAAAARQAARQAAKRAAAEARAAERAAAAEAAAAAAAANATGGNATVAMMLAAPAEGHEAEGGAEGWVASGAAGAVSAVLVAGGSGGEAPAPPPPGRRRPLSRVGRATDKAAQGFPLECAHLGFETAAFVACLGRSGCPRK